jgi:hypothetical protein
MTELDGDLNAITAETYMLLHNVTKKLAENSDVAYNDALNDIVAGASAYKLIEEGIPLEEAINITKTSSTEPTPEV